MREGGREGPPTCRLVYPPTHNVSPPSVLTTPFLPSLSLCLSVRPSVRLSVCPSVLVLPWWPEQL